MIIGHGVNAAGRPSKRPRRGCILRTGRTKVVYLSAHTPRRVPVSRRIAVNPTETGEVHTFNLPSSEEATTSSVKSNNARVPSVQLDTISSTLACRAHFLQGRNWSLLYRLPVVATGLFRSTRTPYARCLIRSQSTYIALVTSFESGSWMCVFSSHALSLCSPAIADESQPGILEASYS